MIACGNVILCYKITGASRGPPPTLVYVNGTINYNLPIQNVENPLTGRKSSIII